MRVFAQDEAGCHRQHAHDASHNQGRDYGPLRGAWGWPYEAAYAHRGRGESLSVDAGKATPHWHLQRGLREPIGDGSGREDYSPDSGEGECNHGAGQALLLRGFIEASKDWIQAQVVGG